MSAPKLSTLSFLLCMMLIIPAAASLGLPLKYPLGGLGELPETIAGVAADAQPPFRSRPVMFIQNIGQFAPQVRFQLREGNQTLWLAEDAIWISVRAPADPAELRIDDLDLDRLNNNQSQMRQISRRAVNLKLSFVGAQSRPLLEPSDRLDTKLSYFVGADPDQWHADVPVWGGVRYVDLYPGLDLVITGDHGRWSWSMVRKQGATTSLQHVRICVEGADGLSIHSLSPTVESGVEKGAHSLRVDTPVGPLIIPLLAVGGEEAELPTPKLVTSTAHGQDAVFTVGSPFTMASGVTSEGNLSAIDIDNPDDLVYSTFLGGIDVDNGKAIAVDSSGNAYVTGHTQSVDFPVTPGAFETSGLGVSAFVAKLNRDGTDLMYATYIGTGWCMGLGIAVDDVGNAYVTGHTGSGFATTPDAYDTSFNGGDYWGDAFVSKLNATGTELVYSTYLGGANIDWPSDIAVSESGEAYVSGWAQSQNFPTTPDAFMTSFPTGGHPAFVVSFNSTGSDLSYSTFLGGSGRDHGLALAVDSEGHAYVTGYTTSPDFPVTSGAYDVSHNGVSDVFVAKLTAVGDDLIYATYLGGSDGDVGTAIAVDEGGNVYVAGAARSNDFPLPAVCSCYTWYAFVAKVDATGGALSYATRIAEQSWTYFRGITMGIHGDGSVYVAAVTRSPDIRTTADAFDTSYNGGGDVFVSRLSSEGIGLLYSTFLGGSGDEIYDWDEGFDWLDVCLVVDGSGYAHIVGHTESSDFPTTTGAFDSTHAGGRGIDAFVCKLRLGNGDGTAYYISGAVTDSAGNPLPSVAISTGAVTTTIDFNGHYVLNHLVTDTYTITPTLNGYTFEPPTRTASLPPTAIAQDFTGLAPLPAPGYLVLEQFESEAGFTDIPAGCCIANGLAYLCPCGDYDGRGAYRAIPAFDGDVRMTVHGQVDRALAGYGCGIRVGIGTASEPGVSIDFGYYPGYSCPTDGYFVGANGVDLDYGVVDCSFVGSWLWIDRGIPYTAELVIRGETASLSVPGVGTSSGIPVYDGIYDMLYVSLVGYDEVPTCSGMIDWVRVEALPTQLYLPLILKNWVSPTEVIVNGGFESSEAWVIPITSYTAGYTATVFHTGHRAMRLGIVESADNAYSYSAIHQQVTLPADATSAILQFWLYPLSGEAGPVPTPMPRPQGGPELMGYVPYDVQYLLVLDHYGRWIDTLLWQCTDERQWTRHEFDLTSYAGRTIKLHFGVYNNGVAGVTGIYLDDVSLGVSVP